MTYDRECTEAAGRIFLRVSQHLLSIRKTFNLPAIDCAIDDENETLIAVLADGANDPMTVESELYDIDHGIEDDE